MRSVTLTQYRPEPVAGLSVESRDLLASLVPDLSISPMFGERDTYLVTAGSHIGNISVGDLSIRIRPKIPIESVFFLLSYALGRVKWMDDAFKFEGGKELLEAIIPGFAWNTRRAFRNGVLQGYRTEEDALFTIRGRVRFDEQVKKRYGIAPPIEVRFDEFTEDILENQLLKAAIARLGKLRIRSQDLRLALREFDAVLGNVSDIHFAKDIPRVHYSRLNERYRPAVELARLILQSTSFEAPHGDVEASAFVINMNKAFEDFVVLALRDALDVGEREFPQGAKGKALFLDVSQDIWLEPDISWWQGAECVFVGDVKYKKVNAEGIKHPDLYQLLAYSVSADLPAGMLIYAAGEGEPASHDTVNVGKRLEVVTLDLAGTPDQILRQIHSLASRIRTLRSEAERSVA